MGSRTYTPAVCCVPDFGQCERLINGDSRQQPTNLICSLSLQQGEEAEAGQSANRRAGLIVSPRRRPSRAILSGTRSDQS